MTKFLTWFGSAILYLALTENLVPANLIAAVLLASLVTVLVRPESGRPFSVTALPRMLWWSARYIVFLAWDVLRCGIAVARIILDPKLPVRQGIIVLNSGSHSQAITVLSAHGITLTPGEQVVGFGNDGAMAVHCLDVVSSAASAEAAQAYRRSMLEKI